MAEINTEIGKKSQENFVVGNRIYILGQFDRSISSDVIPAVVELIDMLQSEKEPKIEIYINSYGGYCAELMGLLALIELAKSRGIQIITYNIGCAYSCGSLLAVVGNYRYMYRYAENLPHLGQAGMTPTTVEQLERGVKSISQHFSRIFSIYSLYTKTNKKQLEKILKDDDYHMDAEECLKLGFCDEII